MLAWDRPGLSPWSANSAVHQVRAKKPRSSAIGSGSISQAPATLVSTNRMRSAALPPAGQPGHGLADPVDLLVGHAGPQRQGQDPGGGAVGLGQGAVGRADPAVGPLAVDRRGGMAPGLGAPSGPRLWPPRR